MDKEKLKKLNIYSYFIVGLGATIGYFIFAMKDDYICLSFLPIILYSIFRLITIQTKGK